MQQSSGLLVVEHNVLSIILFSKSGFARRLVEAAEERDDLLLISVDELVGDLIASATSGAELVR